MLWIINSYGKYNNIESSSLKSYYCSYSPVTIQLRLLFSTPCVAAWVMAAARNLQWTPVTPRSSTGSGQRLDIVGQHRSASVSEYPPCFDREWRMPLRRRSLSYRRDIDGTLCEWNSSPIHCNLRGNYRLWTPR